MSKVVKFELQIMKQTPKEIENSLQVKPISAFLPK